MPAPTVPATLAERIFLMSCDVDRHRVSGRDLAVVLRGAVLAELSLRGCLVEDGRMVRPSGARRTGEPVLDDMLRTMGEQQPRSWRRWLRRGGRSTLRQVRARLAATGVIRVERTRVLGIVPRTRVTVSDPTQVAALRDAMWDVACGDRPVSAVSTEDATLVALVAAGELNRVLPRRDRRAHADRIAAFTERGGAAVPALGQVLRQLRMARVAAATSGG